MPKPPRPPMSPRLPKLPKPIADLKIVQWAIEKLLPYARNARTHSDEQIAQVAASIAEFGWTNPILVGEDGVVIAGHARLAAARLLKMSEVPVIVLDHLTPTQRRALVLADNRLALSAGWDGLSEGMASGGLRLALPERPIRLPAAVPPVPRSGVLHLRSHAGLAGPRP